MFHLGFSIHLTLRQYEEVKVVKDTFPGSCTQRVGTDFLAGSWQGLYDTSTDNVSGDRARSGHQR